MSVVVLFMSLSSSYLFSIVFLFLSSHRLLTSLVNSLCCIIPSVTVLCGASVSSVCRATLWIVLQYSVCVCHCVVVPVLSLCVLSLCVSTVVSIFSLRVVAMVDTVYLI